MPHSKLPLPPHFDPAKVGQVWKVPYQSRAAEAEGWARQHNIQPAADDQVRICLVGVDVQNTFCLPDFELYVAGRSGTGAIDDNRRLCEFIYHNLGTLTQICPTMDTHQALQIFHAAFLVNDKGEHPAPLTLISADDIEKGLWKLNPVLERTLRLKEGYGQQHLLHYTAALKRSGKYDLTIWPYHAMLGGIGHALVSAFEEAVFFHSIARLTPPNFQIKGNNPLTENYSALGPEVMTGPGGDLIAEKNYSFIDALLDFDAIIIAGQAKSHCVASTIQDLLNGIVAKDESLASKVYLLEDCASSVVVPGIVDYTDQADAAFQKFAEAGMRLVRSTDPITSWPGIKDNG
ncbi:MAG: isochorismatase [Chloroflexi bacterium]|nr:isochorismatase [Chloroflexota bacterium]